MPSKRHLGKGPRNRKCYPYKFEKAPNSKTNYAENTEDGYRGLFWEAHHIIPQESFERSINSISNQKLRTMVRDFMWTIPWEINNQENLLGMPTMETFFVLFSNGSKAKTLAYERNLTKKLQKYNSSVSQRESALRKARTHPNPNLPCHNPSNWGHALFSVEVSDYLQTIWNSVMMRKEEHDFTPEDALEDLLRMQKEIKMFLEKRGKSNGGTSESNWNSRTIEDNHWFEPFTMTGVFHPWARRKP